MFPDLRVVSNHTLHIMKYLRAAGHNVFVEPDDNRPLAYTSEKGGSFLADPTIAYLISIPTGVVTSLIATWFSARQRRGREHPSVKVIFVQHDDNELIAHDMYGMSLTGGTLAEILSAGRRSAEIFYFSRRTPAPDPTRPLPIHLEHSGRIVAWAANLEIFDDNRGPRPVGVKFVDPVVEEAVRRGDLPGYSVGGVVPDAICSICGQQYVSCNHIATEWYGAKRCRTYVLKFLLAEISIVADPINPDARIY